MLLDKAKTAAMRYKQPMIFCMSNTLPVAGGDSRNWLSSAVGSSCTVLCMMLMVTAPVTHINVPTILTRLYMQLSFNFSNLHQNATITSL